MFSFKHVYINAQVNIYMFMTIKLYFKRICPHIPTIMFPQTKNEYGTIDLHALTDVKF